MTRRTSISACDRKLFADLVIANRILFDQGIVDAFGHVSVRHDKAPSTYLMSRMIAPGLVTPKDIVLFDLDSNVVEGPSDKHYIERYIHGEIYKARPDVVSVIHCHAPSLIPFGVTKAALRPIYHMSAFLASGVPVFDIREGGGMTDMLVRNPHLGKALATSLADKSIVLMRGHGATIAGASIRQAVHRAIYAAQNAILQLDALKLGEPIFLAPEEAEKATETIDRSLDRAWELWRRLARKDSMSFR